MKNLLIQMVHRAGQELLEAFEKGVAVEFKGPDDLVTAADRQIESLLMGMIRSQYPDHDILAEETGSHERGSDHCWIIDPIDGTTNFAHGFPWFAISIGLEIRQKLVLGGILNPCNQEFFLAERGVGVWLNNRPIKVSSVSSLERSLLATGFPYDRKTAEVNNYDHFINFQHAAQACRRPGAASLDLACVAAGRLDGFWEMKLKPWDLAAGVLMIEEAGGRVSDFDGQPMALDQQECLASNGLIHGEMQVLLQQGRRLPRVGV